MPKTKRSAPPPAKEKTWEERWDAALKEIRRGVPPDVTDEEIERDIDEVRRDHGQHAIRHTGGAWIQAPPLGAGIPTTEVENPLPDAASDPTRCA